MTSGCDRDGEIGLPPWLAHEGSGATPNRKSFQIRVPVSYLHPDFQAFQAIRTGQFLQIS
jgi:hypothetical protein